MAKTVKIFDCGTDHFGFTCDQCGKEVSHGDRKTLEVGLVGLLQKGSFCCNACAAAYARDRGWVVK